MEVVEAADGLEAIEVFVKERPDLVFLDVEMPGMTGLEVCQRIRKMPKVSASRSITGPGSEAEDERRNLSGTSAIVSAFRPARARIA